MAKDTDTAELQETELNEATGGYAENDWTYFKVDPNGLRVVYSPHVYPSAKSKD